MNNFRWVTAFLFVGIVGASSANLSAQNRNGQTSSGEADGSNVENVINEAIEFFRAGRYRLSIEKFQEAYELVEDPNILFNIARCYHLLGEKNNAIEFYNRFIYYPDVPNLLHSSYIVIKMKAVKDFPFFHKYILLRFRLLNES